MFFRSKVDLWLLIALLAGPVASLAAAAHLLRSGTTWVPPVLLVLVGATLPLWILLNTKYIVKAGSLLVQSGPFRWHISAPSITRIVPTRSALSGPALSLDRLRVEYEHGKKSVLVSPANRDAFILAVEAAKAEA